ncbi:MAG TPA: YggS family pyridoxal phosphate-dependent enzyme [Candidatus Limnocylindrales bacterium]
MIAPDPDVVRAFADARSVVLDAIAGACDRVGRDSAGVRLVAVSKTVPAERVRAAIAAGQHLFGENRVQEVAAKVPAVGAGEWHLVGPLQDNKVRRALEVVDCVESVDSLGLARRLDRIVRELRGLPADGDVAIDRRFPVLLQVNVDGDPGKAGFGSEALSAALPELAMLGALRLDGLMTIGHLVADPEAARPTFAALRELAGRVRAGAPALGPELSMGMSDDYPVAVEEGATLVRVGRALFGERAARP